MIDLNAIAKSEGYDFAENIGVIKDGYKIYSMGCNRHACIGLPEFILVKEGKAKVIGGAEGYKLYCWLCDNVYSKGYDEE